MKLLGPDDSMTKQVAKYVSSVGLYVEYLKDNNNNNNKKLKRNLKLKLKQHLSTILLLPVLRPPKW